ncbi:hypothetical protein [Streptomyces sp. NPDC093795]|uniref:hypothetical protein n=1 Tax=Streptomyces sp. NPDC093795 TaxID=3366051 RepID=UPI00382AAAA3
MPVTYEQLKNVDLGPLMEAVTQWKRLPGAFSEIQRSFGSTVTQNLRDSDWTGEAAEAAYGTFTVVEQEIFAAAEEARDVHALLSSAHSRFSAAQKSIRDVESAVAGDRYMRISPEGRVHLLISPEEADQSGIIQKSYSDAVHSYNDAIKRAVADAGEADEALHYALSQDHNGRERGFDADTANSVDAALAQRKAAEKDAEAAKALALDAIAGKNLSTEQLEKLNQLMAAHEGDPHFAEKFAVGLGPRGTVNFWQSVADKQDTGDKETAALADLQKSLGYTLATATHSDSPAMQGWKSGMVDIGPERIKEIDYRAGAQTTGPYSFQVMSSLLRYGQYDTDFLKKYGKDLLAFEQASGGKASDLWRPDGAMYRLNVGGTDRGQDPMAGYMEALGHNPEAAKALFQSENWRSDDSGNSSNTEEMDPELRYLLEERQWPDDGVRDEDKDVGAGWDELGHALEAATLGVPYDAQDLGVRRDAVSANIMEQVVTSVADDTDFLKDRAGIGESLGRMGAGYIDDLNWGLASEGLATGSSDPDDVFRHHGPDHMSVNESVARKFLQIAAQEDGNYQLLSASQQAFTDSAMVAYPDDLEKARMASNAGAYAFGALTEGRISEINATYKDAEDKANLEYAKSAAWKQAGLSLGLSAGVGVAVTPFLGPTAGVAAQTLVPLLVDAGSSALETYWGNGFSEEALENEADFTSKAALDAEGFGELSKERAQSALMNYLELHDVPPEKRTTLFQESLNAYDRGAGTADRMDGNK